MIFKNKDISTNINERGVDIGSIGAKFYTEDEQTASIRIFVKWNDKPVNLNLVNMRPVLNLYMQDGSIFEDEAVKIVMPESGVIQYNVSVNVIKHVGKVNAKLFLVNENESIHAVNFSFNIIDSGVEGPVRKELSFNLVDDAIRRIIKESTLTLLDDTFKADVNEALKAYVMANPDVFKGPKGDPGEQGPQGLKGNDGNVRFDSLTDVQKEQLKADPNDVKDLLIPYTEDRVSEEFGKLSAAKQQDAEVIQARNGMSSLSSRLDEADKKINNTQRVINVKSLGAKGNGKTDDYQIIQDAIYEAERTNSNVYIPSGTYYVSQTLRTAHKTTPHYTTGIRIFGDGKTSVLKGNGASAVDYSDLTKTSKGALIALHGGNNIVENLELTQCTVGIFFGQHPDVSDSYSSVSFNIVENIWMEYVGTGILMVHALGNNYNKFKKIHVLNCQIGVHLAKGIYMTNKFNNNRNTFQDIRVSSAWIGYLVEQADGNSFTSLYGENMTSTAGAIGNQPVQLPEVLNGKRTAIVVLDGQYNFFDKCGVENCEWHLYSVGFRTSFDNMMVRDDAKARSLVMFPDSTRMPQYYHSDSLITPFYIYQPDAGQYFNDSNGMAIKSRLFDLDYHWQSVNLEEYSTNIQSKARASRSKMRRLGGMITWQANYRFAKTASTDKTAPLKIKIPFNNKLKSLDVLYSNEVSTGVTFTFPVYVGISGKLETKAARFSTNAETTALGAPHIIIEPPTNGWNETGEYNNLVFSLQFYNE